MTIEEKCRIRQQQLQTEVHELEQQLKSLPEGKLRCSRNGNQYKWFQVLSPRHCSLSGKLLGRQATEKAVTRTIEKYIPKKSRDLAQKLALKDYILRRKVADEKELRAVSSYLRIHGTGDLTLIEWLYRSAGHRELLPEKLTPDDRLKDWQEQDYPRKDDHPENLKIRTTDGRLVRSKSEAMIASLLAQYHIPYRYECGIELGCYARRHMNYPDFTILHPDKGTLYLWEHAGLIEDPTYEKNLQGKIRDYMDAGYMPGQNLIITYETESAPFGMDDARKTIEFYFL